MDVREMRNEVLGARVVKALESRNMEAYYVKSKEEALKSFGTDPGGKFYKLGRLYVRRGDRFAGCSAFGQL